MVVDASAVLALLYREPFENIAPEEIAGSTISAVNLSEVLATLQSAGIAAADATSATDALEMTVVAFDIAHAEIAATLRVPTRGAGLSLGDRACLATARIAAEPAITADRAWAGLDVGVEVILIR
mgnify:CR=1 FL=1